MATIQVFKRNYNMNRAFGERSQSDWSLYMVQTDGKNAFGAPFAPREVSYSNWGRNWAQVSRDGRLPYLVNESTKLPTMSFTLVVAKPLDQNFDATGTLMILKRLAESTVPIQIRYGGWFESAFKWRCTNLNIKSIYRREYDNAISHAEVDMEFTMVQDVVLTTGPVSGGTSGGSTTVKPPSSSSLGKRSYKVKSGDTLTKLSIKFYKSDKYWRYLADINKIKDPKKLKIGQTIKY